MKSFCAIMNCRTTKGRNKINPNCACMSSNTRGEKYIYR
uniref:Uncharacterized protein n=1 Tax=Rhizophora mucronata TaxID=61149 RepID=A0A2P2R4X1_RHIMU